MRRFGIYLFYNNGLGGKHIRVVMEIHNHFGNIELKNTVRIDLIHIISQAWFEILINL
ncbi:MAG: hypothetical protein K9J30_02745 [Bacteroidales bacterium]|nr:hypothetical protein [Bacteroidales bacterium]